MPAQGSAPPFFFVLELPALHREQPCKTSFGCLLVAQILVKFCLPEGRFASEV